MMQVEVISPWHGALVDMNEVGTVFLTDAPPKCILHVGLGTATHRCSEAF